jgi:hypothetical protein
MAHRGRLNIWQNIFKSTQDIFGEFEVKITIKNILTVMLSTYPPLIKQQEQEKININPILHTLKQ